MATDCFERQWQQVGVTPVETMPDETTPANESPSPESGPEELANTSEATPSASAADASAADADPELAQPAGSESANTDSDDIAGATSPAAATTEAEADPSPDEWTDDEVSEPLSTSEVTASQPATGDEWGEDSLDWEDDIPSPAPTAHAPSAQEALSWLRPLWRRGVTSWQRLLIGLKTRIPAASQLSDGVLSGLLLAGLVLLLLVFNRVRQPAAATPPSSPASPPAAVAPAAAPPPPAPETGDRIGQIQAQFSDGVLAEAQPLIDSVQADFAHDQMTVTLNGEWYRLSEAEQDALAAQFMDRARQLQFGQLQIQSADGTLLARSPVVGDEMVILQRQPPPTVEPPARPRYRLLIDR